MRGVVFDLSLPRYALAKGLGRFVPGLYYGRGSCLQLRELPEPRRPGPGWVRLAPTHAGLCGSDLSTIFLHTSPVLEPFSSFPCVLGHEILARVVDAEGSFREGDRVVVDPILACHQRNVSPPCPACARGEPNRCQAFTRGHLAPGVMLGFHRDLPGGWGDRAVAHTSQLFKVPDGVPDRRAALAEPLAVGVHAVNIHPPRPGDRVLVIGGGMIAMSILAALRLLEIVPREVTLLTLLEYQANLGTGLGATSVIYAPGGPRGAREVTEDVCRVTGATSFKPILGDPIVVGGYDVVFDCVGQRESLDHALRFARAGATVVLVGAAAVIQDLDWTFVWSKELRILGAFCYGREGKRRTFEMVLDRLTDETLASPLDRLVTHEFPLEKYQDAIVANVERGKHRSLKTLFNLGVKP